MILERYDCAGAGPAGGSAKRLEQFLDRWRERASAGKVILLVAHDHTHVLVIAPPWAEKAA